jgi:hypothetical protein
VTTPIPDRKCRQQTKSGRPCKITRLAVWRGYWTRTLVYEASGCHVHATPEERAEYDRIATIERDEAERSLRKFHQSLPLECWSWPVTDEHMRRAEQARASADPEEARHIAWKLLADWQEHRCAVCGGRSERLDHDHKTGLVRGWLCHCCNVGEGFADMPGGQFERYRQKNPATILGIEIRYYSPFTGWAEPEPEIDEDKRLAAHPAYVLAARYGTGAPDGPGPASTPLPSTGQCGGE